MCVYIYIYVYALLEQTSSSSQDHTLRLAASSFLVFAAWNYMEWQAVVNKEPRLITLRLRTFVHLPKTVLLSQSCSMSSLCMLLWPVFFSV